MSRDWKPGDIAMVTGRWAWSKPHSTKRAIRDSDGWTAGDRDVMDYEVSAIRPLVVIDPEDAEQIKRLADAYAKPQGLDGAGPNITAGMTVALRKYANPTPRIEEPPGLGAVVEDDRGCRWVKVDTAMSCDSWTEADAGMSDNPWRKFGSLNAVRVLSEGVPS